MSPSPTGSLWFTSRRRADMPRAPRSSSVLPSSDSRWRLAISCPVTRVSASSAVRRTSSTSSVRLTASATMWRILRCGATSGRPRDGRRRRSARDGERPARRFKRWFHERPLRGREITERSGYVEEQRDLRKTTTGGGKPAGGAVDSGREGCGLQPLTRGRPAERRHPARDAEDDERQGCPRVFVGRRLGAGARQARGHRAVEVLEVERLRDVVERAELEGFLGEADVLVRGHHDDGHAVIQLANAPEDLDAVQAGHPDVEENQIGAAAPNGGQRFNAAGRGFDGVPLRREVLGQDLADGCFIVDDQDSPQSHRISHLNPEEAFKPRSVTDRHRPTLGRRPDGPGPVHWPGQYPDDPRHPRRPPWRPPG